MVHRTDPLFKLHPPHWRWVDAVVKSNQNRWRWRNQRWSVVSIGPWLPFTYAQHPFLGPIHLWQNERKCSGEEVTEQTLQLFFLFHSSSTQTQCLFQPLHIHRTLQIILTYFIGVRINVPMADILFILFGFNQTSKSDGNFNVTRLPNLNYSNTTSAFQWYFSLQSECVFSQSYSQTIKYTLSIQLPLTRSYSFFLWVYRFAHYTTTYTH